MRPSSERHPHQPHHRFRDACPWRSRRPYFWNGVSNVIVDICWTRGNVGVKPARAVDHAGGLQRRRYGVVTSLPIVGCTIDDTNPGESGITRGQSNSRPVFRFTGQA